jgi:anti-sigma regulatory factor (Ser/Thr protein kinase)
MVVMRLPATVGAARIARDALEAVLELEPYEDIRFVAALLTSELVGNAVRHAQLGPADDVGLLAECVDDCVHVEVSDPGPGFVPLRPTQSETGERLRHGLNLLNMLADRWGFRRDCPGCRMWFEIDLVPGRRPWRGREPIPLR